MAPPSAPALRIAVVGAGSMAKSTWMSIHRAGLTVTAVASRDHTRSSEWVKECTEALQKFYGITIDPSATPAIGTYDEVIANPAVDLVYVSVPVTLRESIVNACIQHGKHICLETPVAPSVAVLQSWIEKASARKVLLCHGAIFAYSQLLTKVIEVGLPKIGEVTRVEATCAMDLFPKDATDRNTLEGMFEIDPKFQPMGALGGLGWFCAMAILAINRYTMPTTVLGRILRSATPPNSQVSAPVAAEGELLFDIPSKVAGDKSTKPVSGFFYTSYDTASFSELVISGTLGYLSVRNFVQPEKGKTPYFTVTTRDVIPSPGSLTVNKALRREVVEVPEQVGENCQEVHMWKTIASALSAPEPISGAGARVVNHVAVKELYQSMWSTLCVLEKVVEADKTRK